MAVRETPAGGKAVAPVGRRDGGTRSQLAAMDYEGPGSLTKASNLREQLAAEAEVAKRAGLEAREYLWTAREAERALGRMILAAREAGDLAKDGGNRGNQYASLDSHETATLADYDISYDLAAHSVAVAQVPDEVWDKWHELDTEPTRAADNRRSP